jgi:transcriptional regulator with XRE-family HTH domain
MSNELPTIDRTSPVDLHVGSRIRLRRTLLGMSQERLGEAVGLTFQQVQKYERGSNRVSASRLYDLARVLNVPIQFFYDDMPPELAVMPKGDNGGYPERRGFADAQDKLMAPPMSQAARDQSMDADEKLYRRETMELVRAYYRIGENTRKRVFELIKSMSALDQPMLEPMPAGVDEPLTLGL